MTLKKTPSSASNTHVDGQAMDTTYTHTHIHVPHLYPTPLVAVSGCARTCTLRNVNLYCIILRCEVNNFQTFTLYNLHVRNDPEERLG